MYKEALQATDREGNKIKVGDFVEAFDMYGTNKYLGIVGKVLKIHRQGYDGTILTTDIGLDPTDIYHKSRVAKWCRKVKEKINE